MSAFSGPGGTAVRTDAPQPTDPATVVTLRDGVPVSSGGLVSYPDQTVTNVVPVAALAANPARKKALIQNTGMVNIRVGDASITGSQGIRLTANAVIVFDQPVCPTGAIYVISEGGNSSVAAEEIV